VRRPLSGLHAGAGLHGDVVKAIGYRRISKDANGNGHSLEAQTAAIEQACEARGWELHRVEEDVQSGTSTKKRPGLERALEACRSGEADAIIAAKLDRLSRSVVDAGKILEEARRGGFNIVALDFGLDLSTPQGELVANILTSVSQWERRVISQRTKAALEVVKKKGTKLGNPRPVRTPKRIENRIQKLREQGRTLRQIADRLNGEEILTTRGNAWSPETIRLVLQRVSK
jgi:DNA invertase Pin-like site-specific DNA recombinase